MDEHAFSKPERQAIYRLIAERRDMRRFIPDSKVSDDVLARLLQAAHAAPNVGLMQPWRFIRITDDELRRRIHALVDEERQQTAEALGPRAQEFLALKVEGILDCAELLVVGAKGRAAFPGMLLGSVAEYCVRNGACPVVVVRAGGVVPGRVGVVRPAPP